MRKSAGSAAHPAGLEMLVALLGAQRSLAALPVDGTLAATGKAGNAKP